MEFTVITDNTFPVSINRKSMDAFFSELTKLFVYMIENGQAHIHECPLELEHQSTFEALKVGVDCMGMGLTPLVTRTVLETSNVPLLKKIESTQEIFELKLLEHIIPYLQSCDTESFLTLSNQLCSSHHRGIVESRLTQSISSQTLQEGSHAAAPVKNEDCRGTE